MEFIFYFGKIDNNFENNQVKQTMIDSKFLIQALFKVQRRNKTRILTGEVTYTWKSFSHGYTLYSEISTLFELLPSNNLLTESSFWGKFLSFSNSISL